MYRVSIDHGAKAIQCFALSKAEAYAAAAKFLGPMGSGVTAKILRQEEVVEGTLTSHLDEKTGTIFFLDENESPVVFNKEGEKL